MWAIFPARTVCHSATGAFASVVVKNVEDGDLIAVGNLCLVVDAFDHPVKSTDLLHEVVCPVEAVDWSFEPKVVCKECATVGKSRASSAWK